jgi:hypothetical protein
MLVVVAAAQDTALPDSTLVQVAVGAQARSHGTVVLRVFGLDVEGTGDSLTDGGRFAPGTPSQNLA